MKPITWPWCRRASRDRYRLAWLSARKRAADATEGFIEKVEERNAAYRRADDAEVQLWASGASPNVQVCEYRVPCPGHPGGRSADLIVRKAKPGQGRHWAIISPAAWDDERVWLEEGWTSIHETRWSDAYRWELHAALAMAPFIAAKETVRARQQYQALWTERTRT